MAVQIWEGILGYPVFTSLHVFTIPILGFFKIFESNNCIYSGNCIKTQRMIKIPLRLRLPFGLNF